MDILFHKYKYKRNEIKDQTVEWMKDKIQELQTAKEGAEPSKKRKQKNTHVV